MLQDQIYGNKHGITGMEKSNTTKIVFHFASLLISLLFFFFFLSYVFYCKKGRPCRGDITAKIAHIEAHGKTVKQTKKM